MPCHDDNSCDTGKGSCETNHRHEDECCTLAEDIFCLAECAKHDLLKDKMKKLFEAKIGKKLDKIAEVAVDAILASIENKIAAKEACNSYKENLLAALKG
jgi:hypothetical protein